MKLRFRIMLCIGAMAAAAFACSYTAVTIMRDFWFLPGTYINGTDVSFKSFEDAKNLVEETALRPDGEDYSLAVYGRKIFQSDPEGSADKGQAVAVLDEDAPLGSIDGDDISISVHADMENIIKANRDTNALSLLTSWKREFEVPVSIEYDKSSLIKIARELISVDVMTADDGAGSGAETADNGSAAIEAGTVMNLIVPQDAYIQYSEGSGQYEIIPETEGIMPVESTAIGAIKNAVKDLETELMLGPECYLAAGQTADSPELKEKLETLNRYAKAVVSYDMGELSEVLDVSVFHDWIDTDTLEIDRDKALSWVSDLSARTDTAYTKRTFDIGGKSITVAGPYGFRMDDGAETDLLVSNIMAGEVVTREPVYRDGYLGEEATRENELGKTFVEVDLTAQHVYLYENGKLIGDSDCVTGNIKKGYDTPPGIYPLTYKDHDAVLRGPGYASPVEFWMPFNGGIGLHDASWRSSFGGSIYKTNGSHGCVNLPYDMAKLIFEHAPQKGMAVVCHY